MNKTAQELTEGCNTAAPRDPNTILIHEYNQVIDGLRMQLHLLARRGEHLAAACKSLREQRDLENWNVSACYSIATGTLGWRDSTDNNCEAIKQVKILRAASELKDAEIAKLKQECESHHALFKLSQSKLRKAMATIRLFRNRSTI